MVHPDLGIGWDLEELKPVQWKDVRARVEENNRRDYPGVEIAVTDDDVNEEWNYMCDHMWDTYTRSRSEYHEARASRGLD